jgi:hypothetical protein
VPERHDRCSVSIPWLRDRPLRVGNRLPRRGKIGQARTFSQHTNEPSVQPPVHITNVPQWEEHCRKIHARAVDLLEGRAGVIETARTMIKLRFLTGLTDDPDLLTFVSIDSETDALPVGEVRKYWAAHALASEDVEIDRAEKFFAASAKQAAAALAERFSWAL